MSCSETRPRRRRLRLRPSQRRRPHFFGGMSVDPSGKAAAATPKDARSLHCLRGSELCERREVPILACDVGSVLLFGLGSAALPARVVGTSIPDPAGGLRAVGLSFIGLSGLVTLSGNAALEPGFLRPLKRVLLLLLRAFTPPSRALPHPPPSPQPWLPSGVRFRPSDPPLGRSCLVSALSMCHLCRPRNAPSTARLAAAAAVAAARAAGRAVATRLAALTAAPAPERAAAAFPVSFFQPFHSSRATAEAAAEAASGAQRRH